MPTDLLAGKEPRDLFEGKPPVKPEPTFGERMQAGAPPESLPPEAKAIRGDQTTEIQDPDVGVKDTSTFLQNLNPFHPHPAFESRTENVFERRQAIEQRLRENNVPSSEFPKDPEWRELTQKLGRAVSDVQKEGAGLIVGQGGAAKAVIERGFKDVPTLLQNATTAARQATGKALAWIWEVDPDAAVKAAETGQPHAPASFMQAPRIQRSVDLARSMGYDPMKKAAETMAAGRTQALLEKSGMTAEQAAAERQRLARIESVDPEAAGEAVKARAVEEQSKKIADLKARIEAARTGAAQLGTEAQKAREAALKPLQEEFTKLDKEVQGTLDKGWADVAKIRDVRDPRFLGQAMAGKIKQMRQLVTDHAETRYRLADTFAGDETASTAPAKQAAGDFVEQLPEDLRRNMPTLMKSIGEMEQGKMTFGQLHYLRSQLRDLGYLDNEKLSPSFKRGPYKYLSAVVDSIIHDSENTPGFKLAAKALDSADAYYAKEMARFKNNVVQNLVDNIKDGMPPNPVAIARQIVQGTKDNAARLQEILKIAGPKVAEKIRSADYDDIFNSAREPLSNEINAKDLLREVDTRFKNGTLQQLWGQKEAQTLVDHVRRLAAKEGNVPIEQLPPDRFAEALRKANELSAAIDEIAKQDPVKLMDDAIKKGKDQAKALAAGFKEMQAEDVLAPLAKPRLMAARAAETLLQPENLPMLRAAITRWGEDSEAVKRIRLVALERSLAPLMRGEDPAVVIENFGRMTRGQQEALFPHGMADDIKTIVEQLKFMYGPKPKTMPAFAAGSILDESLRAGLTKYYYRTTMAYLVTHPRFIRTIAASTRAGGEYAKQARRDLREVVSKMMASEYITHRGFTGESQPEPPPPVQNFGTWRQRAAVPQRRVGGWRSLQ